MNRRRFLKNTAWAAMGSAVVVGGYTWKWEPHWVEFVQRPLPLHHLPEELAGKRLVQLSDLHIGPRVSDEFLLEAFEKVNDVRAEFVVYTGDFTSFEGESCERARRVFPRLPRGRVGTFAVLGNHDYGIGWRQAAVADRIVALARDAGVTMLRNSVAEAGGLQVIGLDDLWAKQFAPEKVLRGVFLNKPTLVLSHNPDTADLPVWDGYQGWILSGHTHGGQCKPPFLPPPLLPVQNRRYTAGEFELSGGRRIYINRGLGHLLQVRFNARPEVTVFSLARIATGSMV